MPLYNNIITCTFALENYGPFVYWLGRQVFILERGVRFPYGLHLKFKIWQIINLHSNELDQTIKKDY